MAAERKEDVAREGVWLWRLETFKPYSGGIVSQLTEYEQGDRSIRHSLDISGISGVTDMGGLCVELARTGTKVRATQGRIDEIHAASLPRAREIAESRRALAKVWPSEDVRCGWCSGRGYKRERDGGGTCSNCKGSRLAPVETADSK